jgi:rod shape-determining protein MreC
MPVVVGHQPPPIFRRGPAPLVRLLVFAAIALAMLVTDLRFRYLEVLRQAISVVTYPLQIAAATPADVVRNASLYFATLLEVQGENAELRHQRLETAQKLLRFDQLAAENAQLRGLLEMGERTPVKAIGGEILYSVRDPYSRKVVLNKGSQQGIATGLAVVDPLGVVGQVTRVYPIQSEVTLLTDKNQAIPVMVQRSGLHGVAFGAGQGALELRFVEANADVQPGDHLVTSGLDGVFLAGLPVAVVNQVDRGTQSFERINCTPATGVERSRLVMVLGPAVPPAAADAAPDGVEPSAPDVAAGKAGE